MFYRFKEPVLGQVVLDAFTQAALLVDLPDLRVVPKPITACSKEVDGHLVEPLAGILFRIEKYERTWGFLTVFDKRWVQSDIKFVIDGVDPLAPCTSLMAYKIVHDRIVIDFSDELFSSIVKIANAIIKERRPC